MFATLGTDIVMRFLPLEWFTFRAWEAYKLDRAPSSAFVPNVRYHSSAVYGDLAALGNLPSLREYRPEVFTTDQFGFRNLPRDWAVASPAALLIGSSFSVGPGMTDEQTLGRQLTEIDGRLVYNASGYFDEISVARIRTMARATGMQSGTVILEYVERFDLPPPGRTSGGCGAGYPTACTPAHELIARFRGISQISPFQILIERGLKSLQNDVVLPNRYSGRVVQSQLTNGATMLFLPEEVTRFERLQRGHQTATNMGGEYLRALADQLADNGFDLIVLLVPNKYTVYRPFISDLQHVANDAQPYLLSLEDRLRALNVRVVNLTRVFQIQAASDLQQSKYIYWRDDTHWNPRGIHLAATELQRAWPR
ncbi:MAG: alginate O-acetyltransferase AlgX-related protein [Chloroflexota bacterium]